MFSELIAARLESQSEMLQQDFRQHGRIQSCFIDDLLPEGVVREIHAAFPRPDQMTLKKSLREFKYVTAQMDKYNPLLEQIVYAFQDQRVLDAVTRITGIPSMVPDRNLYAGGISLMSKGQFLNPHLDNSHDKSRDMYRVLNLLFYATPDWHSSNGGNLELWDKGPKGKPREIVSKFNRLVLMATHEKSWHSVNKVVRGGNRCCVSNYYFSKTPIEGRDYFHVTSFRGRPDQPVRDLALRADAAARMAVRKVFSLGIIENPHIYKHQL